MEDKRCCGSGACIINAEGLCWCGQKWDGDKLITVKNNIPETKDFKKHLTNKNK